MQRLSSSTRKLLAAAGVFAALGALPLGASAKLVCTSNETSSSCTCNANTDPNCSMEWCDGLFMSSGPMNTCTILKTKPKSTKNEALGGFGLKGNMAGSAPIVLPGKPAAPTKN